MTKQRPTYRPNETEYKYDMMGHSLTKEKERNIQLENDNREVLRDLEQEVKRRKENEFKINQMARELDNIQRENNSLK